MAGITFSTRSLVRNLILEVLMQGWQPTNSLLNTSSSIRSCTRCSVSFISPRNADGAGGDVEELFHVFRLGKRQTRGANL